MRTILSLFTLLLIHAFTIVTAAPTESHPPTPPKADFDISNIKIQEGIPDDIAEAPWFKEFQAESDRQAALPPNEMPFGMWMWPIVVMLDTAPDMTKELMKGYKDMGITKERFLEGARTELFRRMAKDKDVDLEEYFERHYDEL